MSVARPSPRRVSRYPETPCPDPVNRAANLAYKTRHGDYSDGSPRAPLGWDDPLVRSSLDLLARSVDDHEVSAWRYMLPLVIGAIGLALIVIAFQWGAV